MDKDELAVLRLLNSKDFQIHCHGSNGEIRSELGWDDSTRVTKALKRLRSEGLVSSDGHFPAVWSPTEAGKIANEQQVR